MRNEFIDIYKFILCFYIVLFHFYSGNNNFFGSGFVAVEIFMILLDSTFLKNFLKKVENAIYIHI